MSNPYILATNATSTDLVIFGTGALAEVAYFYFTHDSPYRVVAFTCDKAYCTESTYMGLPLVPFEELADSFPADAASLFVAIGFSQLNQVRLQKYTQAKELGYTLASYVSTQSCLWQVDGPGSPVWGDNCFILENQTLQPYVTIGNNVVLWSGNHIGHHAAIEDHCFLASHIVVSGGVSIGPRCFVGVNATIGHGVTIGADSLIGAGALVLKDTEPHGIYRVKATERYKKSTAEVQLI